MCMYEDTVNQGRTVFSCDLIIRSLCCSMSFKLLTCVSSYLITSWRSTSLICGCKSMHLQRDKGGEGETREKRDERETRGIRGRDEGETRERRGRDEGERYEGDTNECEREGRCHTRFRDSCIHSCSRATYKGRTRRASFIHAIIHAFSIVSLYVTAV